MSVSVADVLDFLVSPGATPSNLGAQLERLRDGTTGIQDPFRSRDEVETGMIRMANLIRCIDRFEERPELNPRGKRIQEVSQGRNEGAMALGVLRAYHEWSSSSQERGLVEVYKFLARTAPRSVPNPPKDSRGLLQDFREGKAKRCRFLAAEAYADALIALQQHVRIYNDDEVRKSSRSSKAIGNQYEYDA